MSTIPPSQSSSIIRLNPSSNATLGTTFYIGFNPGNGQAPKPIRVEDVIRDLSRQIFELTALKNTYHEKIKSLEHKVIHLETQLTSKDKLLQDQEDRIYSQQKTISEGEDRFYTKENEVERLKEKVRILETIITKSLTTNHQNAI
ncbi:MAG: hypothetical protein AAF443_08220 [Chlamydiota bacterium]